MDEGDSRSADQPHTSLSFLHVAIILKLDHWVLNTQIANRFPMMRQIFC